MAKKMIELTGIERRMLGFFAYNRTLVPKESGLSIGPNDFANWHQAWVELELGDLDDEIQEASERESKPESKAAEGLKTVKQILAEVFAVELSKTTRNYLIRCLKELVGLTVKQRLTTGETVDAPFVTLQADWALAYCTAGKKLGMEFNLGNEDGD